MAAKEGTNGNDVFYMNTLIMAPNETAHSYVALGGDDTVYGSSYMDFIQGGLGNDKLYGYAGDDALIGQDGNDSLYGGVGNDFVHGGNGNDFLNGEAAQDNLCGGFGNDIYFHAMGQGRDTINDNASESLMLGYGGGVDTVILSGLNLSQVTYFTGSNGQDLWLTSTSDASDGMIDDGVVIEGFFQGGNYVVEYLQTNDYVINIAQYFGVA